jgi:hypothetical protein
MNTPFKPASRFVCEIFQIERAHRALQPDMQLADLAFGQRVNTNTMECAMLEKLRDMFKIPREPREVFVSSSNRR